MTPKVTTITGNDDNDGNYDSIAIVLMVMIAAALHQFQYHSEHYR